MQCWHYLNELSNVLHLSVAMGGCRCVLSCRRGRLLMCVGDRCLLGQSLFCLVVDDLLQERQFVTTYASSITLLVSRMSP